MQNVSEHFSCYNYVNDRQPAIELKNLRKNTLSQFYAIRYKLFFLLEGKVLVEVGVKNALVERGHFWFVPLGEVVKIKTLDNSVIIVLRTEVVTLCECYTPERLYSDMKDENHEKPGDYTLYTTLIHPSLWHCLSGLSEAIADNLFCRPYFNLKIKEIFLLLRAYYTKQELYLAFYTALTGDISFSEAIRNLWIKHSSVKDLAKEMGYTPSGFYKRFTSVFGVAPSTWLLKQRELLIHSDLKSSDLSLKGVSRKWSFSSVQSLSNYCKKCYGATPMQIRECKLSETG